MSSGWRQLVVLGGRRQKGMLFASRRLFTAAVTCPLKLSMMIMAGVLLQWTHES